MDVRRELERGDKRRGAGFLCGVQVVDDAAVVSGGVPNLADPVHAFQVDRQGQPGFFGIKGDQLDQIAEGYDLNFRRIWRTSTSMRANSMR